MFMNTLGLLIKELKCALTFTPGMEYMSLSQTKEWSKDDFPPGLGCT